VTRSMERKPWPPAVPREQLTPDAAGQIRCPRDRALLAFVENGPGSRQRTLRMAPGLMRLGKRGSPMRYGLPQGARRGIHPPLRRSPPPGAISDLTNWAGHPLRKDLPFRILVYCPAPGCGKAWEILTREFPPEFLPDIFDTES